MRIGESFEKRDVESTATSSRVPHERRKLIVITDEYERGGETEGAQTSWKRYLRGFIDDADVKLPAGEDRSGRGDQT